MLKITKKFVEENPKLVTMKQSIRYPDLYVVKYNNKVFYDNAWTPELMEARGLVVDKDFNVVVRPFDKIFNYMENGTKCHRDTIVQAVEKRNGFLGVMTFNEKYGWLYSTTGSLDSKYADIAREHLQKYEDRITGDAEQISLMFEICDESDPHIIKEQCGEYLIGMYDWSEDFDCLYAESVLDMFAFDINVRRPKRHLTRFGDLLVKCKTSKIEGYVVRAVNTDIPLMKIKTPYYLTCKFIGRLKNERLDALLENTNKFKQKLRDEEFFPLIDMIKENYEVFTSLDEQGKISWLRNKIEMEIYK